jgi:stress response protein YsnF
MEAGTEETIPILEERLQIERRRRESGIVRVRIVPHEEHHLIDEPVLHDAVDVTRVPVERLGGGSGAGAVGERQDRRAAASRSPRR